MHVSRLELRGFLTHNATCLDLPEHGLVLVVGRNGQGKSALLEGVSMARWGKTLRGTSPWSADAGDALVRASDVDAHRHQRKGKVSLEWCLPGQAVGHYATTTKAQDALESVIGGWDSWRRTCVFRAQDAAVFTSMTDADRKRFIEQLLGLYRFEPALARCRTDLRVAEREVLCLETEHAARLREEDQAKGALEWEAAQVGERVTEVDQVKLRARATALRKAIDDTDSELRGKNAELRTAMQSTGREDAMAQQAQALLVKLDHDACPTCGQAIPMATRTKLREDAEAASAAVRARGAALEAVLRKLHAEIATLTEERTEFVDAHDEAQTAARQAEAAALAQSQTAERVERARQAAQEARQGAAEAEAGVASARRRAALLGAVEGVLGLRGVRAAVLSQALGGIEAVANGWLARIAGSALRLRLTPTVEGADGIARDVIGLEIQGAGGGFGYAASSAGEQRRIDLALLLALADVAAGAQGIASGDLYFDEAIDRLDAEGVAAMVGVLEELAETRLVMLITHNEELKDSVRWSRCLHVEKGVVTG